MPKYDVNLVDLKLQMKAQGIKVGPAYVHKDYIFTSFTMPHPLKSKLDRVGRKYSISRSKIVQLLIESIDEEKFLEQMGYGK